MKQYTIGVDLGGTNIAVGLVDDTMTIVDRVSAKTALPRPEIEVEQSIAALCKELVDKNHLDFATQIEMVGIGTPGSVDPRTGIVDFSANFGYHNWHLKEDMQKYFPVAVYVENDANAAAYGEYIAGGAKGAECAVVVTLGTGIGSGIIIDGKIFSGFNSAGAEMGHIVIEKGGRPCMCGRRGCWEKYASASALTQDTQEAMKRHKDNMMWGLVNGNIDKVNAKTAFDAMRAGDELGKAIVDNFLSYVSCGITNIINIFQPEIICIGGGVSREGDTMLKPIKEYVDKEEYARTGARRTKIVTAQLRNDAGIVGAACLGHQQR